MNARLKWHSLRQTVLDDAELAHGQAHLESPEVPQWIEETGDQDIAATLGEALSNVDDKPRNELNALLVLLCQKGDDIAQRKAVDLLDSLRKILTDHCVAEAQRWVDGEMA